MPSRPGRHDAACPDPAASRRTPGGRAALDLARTGAKFEARVGKACGGADRICAGEADEVTPAALGFGAPYPGLDGTGAACKTPLADCGEVAACLACIGGAAVDRAVAQAVDALNVAGASGDRTLRRCQEAVGKETASMWIPPQSRDCPAWSEAS